MPDTRFPAEIQGVVDHLFREQYGRMVSTLTRAFGAGRLDLAESVVQDAIIQAMQTWPAQGMPDNPVGWLVRAAKNRALDLLRHEQVEAGKREELTATFSLLSGDESEIRAGEEAHLHPVLRDDQLRLIFTCCHPALSREARIALTLKTLCGFSLEEIARAFLAKPDTIEQRIIRAKQKIREEGIAYEIPEPSALAARLDSALEVFYLLFNEGYSATEGEDLVRAELCEEAIRGVALLASSPTTALPKVHALLALMWLQSSRLGARTDASGGLLLLSEQDRSRWDRPRIARGLRHLEASAEGEELTDYHLQASIAACHAIAPDHESTDWERILSDYDELLERSHSPVVALNRAVALGMARGPQAAIDALEAVRELPPMKSYYLLPATLAEFHARLGQESAARRFYGEALALVGTAPERRFLEKKLRLLGDPRPA
jgi:RNA polymerase sigma-70 factor (ECF subfamily)